VCGIAAVHVGSGQGPRRLNQLLGRLEHRGLAPTLYESAVDCPGGWCLGTNRLPIVAPVYGRQPVRSPGGRFVVAFNGEVFNYGELASALRADQAHPPNRSCDTQVLAAALEEWAVLPALDRLVWEGAFLALDCDSGQMWAARDHLGIKPLYRAAFRDGVAFASEIKALVGLPGCGHVRPVRPGTAELFDAGGAHRQTSVWWDLDGRDTRQQLSVDEAKQELLDALRQAVHCRVPRCGQYAVALSGGLDSGAILRLAVETGRKPRAYVLHRPGSPDLRFARLLCRELDVPLTEVEGWDGERLRARMSEVVSTVETWEWQVVNHAAPMLALTAAIREDGHRVVLSGEGADELFLGYARSTDISPRREQIRRVAALHRTNCRRLDRMGMRDQLEFRVPFLDRTVTELALGLPTEYLTRDGVPKWILRESLRELLPVEIIERPKLAMARGAGYEYSATTPTVFGELPSASSAEHPLMARLPRYPAERVFLELFIRCGYAKADYVLEHSL
jgi:asparagine synthase (glutamine-hydrolysing)